MTDDRRRPTDARATTVALLTELKYHLRNVLCGPSAFEDICTFMKKKFNMTCSLDLIQSFYTDNRRFFIRYTQVKLT